ncbi:MAG TPA: radical SAM protein [Candidatus Acidoferrum sp.]|nr:radical SAM protein [Candidatus Acidoferrum sp.]
MPARTSSEVVLINPPLSGGDVTAKLNICTPPLGLAYIASYLREHGHKVTIIDTQVDPFSGDALIQTVQNANLIGITSSAPTYNAAIVLANLIKHSCKDATIVIGGPQATYLDSDCLARSRADAVVRGEGEITMLEIADALTYSKVPQALYDIDGITYRSNDEILKNEDRRLLRNLDEFPFPARDLLPMDRYKPPKSTGVISSRGCPFRCIFCASSKLNGKKFRPRSAYDVFSEVSELVRKGYEHISMLDDNFILDTHRVFEFADLVEDHQLKFDWSCTARVDLIDDELLARLHEVGCNGLFFGVESSSNETLEIIKKGFKTDQVLEAFDILKDHSMTTTASFMIGLPGDNAEKVKDTIDFAKTLNPDFAMFSITTPYPGTELYENIDNYDIEITLDDWSNFTLTKPVVKTSMLSTRDLQRWFVKAYCSYYLRFSYLKRAVKRKQIGFIFTPLWRGLVQAAATRAHRLKTRKA